MSAPGGVEPRRGPEGADGDCVAQRLLPLYAGAPGQEPQLCPRRHDLLQQHTHLSRVSPDGGPAEYPPIPGKSRRRSNSIPTYPG